jgi:hypothetical protein
MVTKVLIFSQSGWQICSSGDNVSSDSLNTSPPSREQLSELSVPDMVKILDRSNITTPSRLEKARAIDMILKHWAIILEETPVQIEEKVSRTDLLAQALALGIRAMTHTDSNGKIKKKALSACNAKEIQELIVNRQRNITSYIGDEDTSSISASSVTPSVTGLPAVQGMSLINELHEELSPRSPRFMTPRNDVEAIPTQRVLHDDPQHSMPAPVSWEEVQEESAKIIQYYVRLRLLNHRVAETTPAVGKTLETVEFKIQYPDGHTHAVNLLISDYTNVLDARVRLESIISITNINLSDDFNAVVMKLGRVLPDSALIKDFG